MFFFVFFFVFFLFFFFVLFCFFLLLFFLLLLLLLFLIVIHRFIIGQVTLLNEVLNVLGQTGPSCSKLTTSLVNYSLKFTSSDSQIC